MPSSVHIYTQKRWICLNDSLSFFLTPITNEFYLLSDCISMMWPVICTLLNTTVSFQPQLTGLIRNILNSWFLLCIGNNLLIWFPDYHTVLMILWSLFQSLLLRFFLVPILSSIFLKKKMWTTFKVFIEFITVFFLFSLLVFWHWGMWDLSYLARNQTCTPTAVEGEILPTGPLGISLSSTL